MKVAALDLGTNSFLCLIAEGDAQGLHRVISDQAKVVRLGQGVHKTGFFQPEALVRARACLQEFRREIDRHQVDHILAMATSAARDAKNGSELFKIGEELKIPIEIIPGSDEARITFRGATEGSLPPGKNILVIDVGGGSTEIIVGNSQEVLFAKSLNVGCVRLTEKLITQQPVSSAERSKVEEAVDQALATIANSVKALRVDEVLAVAGTPSSLAAAELGGFDAAKVQGFILDENKLQTWCDRLAIATTAEKIEKYHIEAGRADVIFVGATLLQRFLRQVNQTAMKVSIKGVRYGVALEILSRH